MEYVSNTFDVGITYTGEIMNLHGFCDSDWAGDQDTRRFTTGFLVFTAGRPIAWQSRLQTTIAASSMEAEYMAVFALIQEICRLRGVMSELGFELEEPTRVYKSKCHRFGKQSSTPQEVQAHRNQISLVETEDQRNGRDPGECSITYATCRHANQGVS